MRLLKHPIRSIREPFGTAGLIVACIALVAALGGTALAAAKLNSTQKKEVERIAKKYAGKAGANGAAGPQGPAGANGKDGANGSNGAAGSGVTTSSFSGNAHGCSEGGTEVVAAGDTSFVCNGKKGSNGQPGLNGSTILNGAGNPSNTEGEEGDFYVKTGSSPEMFGPKTAAGWGGGTPLQGPQGEEGNIKETLPPGTQLKGTWTAGPFTASAAGDPIFTSGISFGIPTEVAVNPAIYLKKEEEESPELPVAEPFRYCGGSYRNPTVIAPSTEFTEGSVVLCVFAAQTENFKIEAFSLTGSIQSETSPASPNMGLVIKGEAEGPGPSYAYGTWVVKTIPAAS